MSANLYMKDPNSWWAMAMLRDVAPGTKIASRAEMEAIMRSQGKSVPDPWPDIITESNGKYRFVTGGICPPLPETRQ
jgi:hypothetical protein